MKKLLRLLSLVGATIFGLASITQIVTLVYTYIETYRLPFPAFITGKPGFHRFPIYRLNRDLRDVAPILFAFICCVILYRYSVKLDKENVK